ncbi:hypothetical protein [Bradyrhizobium sp. McL0616]|uniref:hypothetical protein n=1 Tax=Bradyrhizobium sp. McL0616 TaxID=3415674 RepID=UPI003CE6F185
MSLSDVRLSILAFPQRWDGNGNLDLNIVVIPVGDPLAALTPTGPSFAGTELQLQAIVIPGLDALPAPASPAVPFSISTPLPPNQIALFGTFLGTYPIDPEPIKRVLGPDVRVRKSLPPSYLAAAGVDAPGSADTTVGDEFGCSLLGQDPGATRRGSQPPRTISWGALLSFALRQPRVARELGLIYQVSLPVHPSDVIEGGWVYVHIDPAGDAPYSADSTAAPALVRSYAARLPPLHKSPRRLFAAVLFPVVPPVGDPAAYDEADLEAQVYDDGFATVVHCDQPTTFDAASGDHGTLSPATDAGIQIGWDDEQVTTWQNRQLDIARARQAATDPPAEVPLGVFGYRVDVSDDAGSTWASLCMATQQFAFGPLQGPQPFEGMIEPTPVRANRPDDNHAWLPRYFAQWRGGSMVADDPVVHEMTGGGLPPPSSSLRALAPTVDLRYGRRYAVRVRLADISGGGPLVSDQPEHPGAASISHWDFKRHVPPKAVRIATTPPRPPMPAAGTAPQAATATAPLVVLDVLRPLIGYPEMRFTGLGDADLLRFRQLISLGVTTAPGEPAGIFGLPDPDVDTLHIIVEARSLAPDDGGAPPLDGAFRVIYELERAFPVRPADPLAEDVPLTISLTYVDVGTISSLVAPAAGLVLPIPTARDVRIRLSAMCKGASPDYFGSDAARIGITVDLTTRKESSLEDDLLIPVGAHGAEAFFLQPGSDAAARLAQQLDLDVKELTFSGRPGSRTVVAASRFLRHTLSGDHNAITLASREELAHQWIVAIRFDLARDWTWDGLADEGIAVERDDTGKGPIGSLELRRTATPAALAPSDEGARREITRLVFFDAVNPQPSPKTFPTELRIRYHLRPKLTGSAAVAPTDVTELRLPVTVNPAQIPRLASAGVALTPYLAADDYSSTQPRRRALWLELAEPVADPNDAIFARILAYAQDPLLAPFSALPDVADEPPLSLPDEKIRFIAPGQSRDDAGLAAMTRLLPSAGSAKHFLLPLPDGVDANSLALFGLWTYELRIGHVGEWSTAQARFGRPLRVAGVQHPAPTLYCAAGRVGPPDHASGILASAPLATSVTAEGKRLRLRDLPGNTSMYFLLYAQARQADGLAWRNILLVTRQGNAVRTHDNVSQSRDVRASAFFTDEEIRGALDHFLLSRDSRLSILAVELMPEGTVPQKTPLTDELGSRRILRTSPLEPVHAVCPPETAPLPRARLHPGLAIAVDNHAPLPAPHE